MKPKNIPLVRTIEERCKTCYTCVRECPAKAIKIQNGQAMVIEKRCIGCGNCVKVCSQGAKVYYKSKDAIISLLNSTDHIVAAIAPSFAAEFSEYEDHKIIVGMIKALGFKEVFEVAFGADIVADRYNKLFSGNKKEHYISSDCPAIVNYIEKYYPHLVKHLVPVVSPMIATARIIKHIYGNDLKIVFIGPCIAKKDESDEVEEVLTFTELRSLLAERNITSANSEPSDFNEPVGGKGAIFPLSRGLLQTIDMEDNILEGNIIVADGRMSFQEAIKEFNSGLIQSQHMELLCCEGCIMGTGMTNQGQCYTKRASIRNYVFNKLKLLDEKKWEQNIKKYKNLDYSQKFYENDQNVLIATDEEIEKILKQLGKQQKGDHLNCGACGYDTCVEHALAISKGLAETEMCLPFTIEKLHRYVKELAVSNQNLASMKQALHQSEKLAHMGQLSAGIAHELNNPLGVIIMYSNILLEECKDSQMKEDLDLIVEQTARCKKIVGGLLNFARNNQVRYESIKMKKLLEDCLHSIVIPSNVTITKQFCFDDLDVMLDKEQMIQAISNLIKNSIDAMPNGGDVKIIASTESENVFISIADNGVGISKENIDKIFTPFFTTKQAGKGTGLGLPTTYGIIKMHRGDITMETNDDPSIGQTGTTFNIKIPKNNLMQ